MNWPRKKLIEVANIVTGSTPPRSSDEFYGGEIPWVRPPELGTSIPITDTDIKLTTEGAEKCRLIPENSVLVCCIGSIGKVGIAGRKLATNQQINALIFNHEIYYKYGFYFCLHQEDHFRKTAPSAVVPIINKTNFGNYEIPLPPLREQHRIVEILDQADALRRQRREADAISQKILPALFQDMFGHLPFDEKRLGEHLSFLTSGSRGWAEHYSDDGALFIRIQNVGKITLSLNDCAFVVPPKSKEAERTKVQPRDVLLSITADLGRTSVIPDEFGDGYINQHLAILRTNSLNPYFLAAFLESNEGKRQIGGMNRAAVKAGLNFTDIRNVQIPLATIDKQNAFEQQVLSLHRAQGKSTSSASTLEALFQTLLHRAFDGSLTASWRADQAKEMLQEMELHTKK